MRSPSTTKLQPDNRTKVAPGICDGISARCALEAGFTCLYQSGAATTASRLGMPDLAIATMNDFVEVSCLQIPSGVIYSYRPEWCYGIQLGSYDTCHRGC